MCQIDPYFGNETSFNRIARDKRITKQVRLCSSLYLMKKTSLTISKDLKNVETANNKKQPGQSDRRKSSKNPLTKKIGVDKKKATYSRYLARKKGNIIRSDKWKYVSPNIGRKPYTPYSNYDNNYSKQCCCNNVCLDPDAVSY